MSDLESLPESEKLPALPPVIAGANTPEIERRVENFFHSVASNGDARRGFFAGYPNPESITDVLVEDTVRLIPEFHEAWIKSFNMRCARRP